MVFWTLGIAKDGMPICFGPYATREFAEEVAQILRAHECTMVGTCGERDEEAA